MPARLAATLGVALFMLFAPALALDASADDGTGRPPEAVLRHVDASRAPAIASAPSRKELVILVGGYQSCSCQDDPMFRSLRTRFEAAGFDVIQFGRDPRFPYDTYGRVATNAIHLRDEIRTLSPSYGAVHLVTHSMGGVVADQAFSAGLSRADGVATYVSLASPHSGSGYARGIELVHAAAGDDGGLLRSLPLLLGMESSSDAVRDLARATPVRPPAGVVRLDLREVTDVLVTGYDHADPGVASRVLTGALEGHGGILDDRAAIDLTLRTMASRRVPPDDRAILLTRSAEAGAAGLGSVLLLLTIVGTVVCAGAAVCRRFVPGALASWPFLPRAVRRACP